MKHSNADFGYDTAMGELTFSSGKVPSDVKALPIKADLILPTENITTEELKAMTDRQNTISSDEVIDSSSVKIQTMAPVVEKSSKIPLIAGAGILAFLLMKD